MKTLTSRLFPVLLIAIAFSACTLEKRQYMSGYHIDFKHKSNATTVQTNPEKTNRVTTTPSVNTGEQTVVSTGTVNAVEPEGNNTLVNPPVVKANSNTKPTVTTTSTESTGDNTLVRSTKADSKQEKKSGKKGGGGPSKGLLIVLAILIPWLAVGLVTDWEVEPLVINLLLCLTCIGGIIHAIIVVNREA